MARVAVLSALISGSVSVAATTLILAWFVYVTPAGAQVKQVEAGEYRLVGSDGTLRLAAEETRFGGANLRVVQNGANRITIVSGNRDAESSGVNLNDTAGQRRVWIALKQGEHSGETGAMNGMAIFDTQQRIRVHMGVDDEAGTPFLRFFDEDGALLWSAPID